jgi:hypothetical protein
MRALVIAVLVAAPALAAAQPNPTFTYRKAEDVEEVEQVEWTASAEVGLVVTTGNSETVTATASGKIGRKAGKNKLEVTTSLAYARASTRGALDRDGNGTIGPGEIVGETKITAETATAGCSRRPRPRRPSPRSATTCRTRTWSRPATAWSSTPRARSSGSRARRPTTTPTRRRSST